MKRTLYTIIIGILFSFFPQVALGGTINAILWDIPTLTIGNKPFDIKDLGGYIIHCGKVPGVYTIVKDLGKASQLYVQSKGRVQNYVMIADVLPTNTNEVYYCGISGYTTSGKKGYISVEIVRFPPLIPSVPELQVK